MSLNSQQLQEAIARAKAQLAAKQQSGQTIKFAKPVPVAEAIATLAAPLAEIVVPPVPAAKPMAELNGWNWNSEQSEAIKNGVLGRSFCLIGAAGTGKTTTLRGLLKAKLESNGIPMLRTGTQHLYVDTPGVVLVSYTRRAVRNIARQMPAELKDHCLTIHKLLEFAPEKFLKFDEETGKETNSMRFVPTRHQANPLPEELRTIVVDESSMVSIDLFEMLLAALPNPGNVQFIFLGDLNQLPPVYGQAVLGQKLLQLPIVELTQVYRQALESPIIALALAVKNNNFTQFNKDAVELWSGDRFKKPDGKFNFMSFDVKDLNSLIDRQDKKKPATITLEKPGRGKVTLQVWKNRTETEVGLAFMQGQLKNWIDRKLYDPLEDLVLCPWNESFGTTELNLAIADKLAKDNDLEVHEVIAGYKSYYYALGDKLLVDKQDAIIIGIEKNPKYLGKRPAHPSKQLDRWGNHADRSIMAEDLNDLDVDALLESLGADEERVAAASHIIKVRFLDSDAVSFLDKAAELNATSFAYAITVHKAQGSECRKVFFLTHYCHSAMLFRELVYTAITRAAEELHIVMSPMMLQTAASKPRIKGDTLQAKLEFYSERLKERITRNEQD